MNRIEMQEEINRLVPELAKEKADEFENAERLRKSFACDYPVNRIADLSLTEYVNGFGKKNRSFCCVQHYKKLASWSALAFFPALAQFAVQED
jgi:hypothetical protein